MSSSLTRRDAIRFGTFASLPVVVNFLSSSPACAEVNAEWDTGKLNNLSPMKVIVQDIGRDHKRHDILKDASLCLHTLFRREKEYNNAYTLRINNREGSPNEWVDDKYWNECNLAKHPQFNTRRQLLWVQHFFLKDTATFPTIHVKPFYEQNTTWGKAFRNKVMTKYDPTRANGKDYTITGEFEVFVNLYHLGAQGDGSSAIQWASVIAHEMLHNLGHLHLEDEYGDHRQINAFTRAIYCMGEYNGGKKVPGFG